MVTVESLLVQIAALLLATQQLELMVLVLQVLDMFTYATQVVLAQIHLQIKVAYHLQLLRQPQLQRLRLRLLEPYITEPDAAMDLAPPLVVQRITL